MIEKILGLWKMLGPGLVTGAADDDPSGVATYSQAGAQYGFGLLWMSLFSFPLMSAVQEMCARIGLVTGRGLAEIMRSSYSRFVLFVAVLLLFIANAFNIGADLGAMAEASRLLLPQIPFVIFISFFALVSILLQVFVPYKTYVNYLKYATFALLSYIVVGVLIGLPWAEVLKHTLVPDITFTRDQILLVCAILGTTISPYLFFWQPSQEVEEEILKGEDTVEKRMQSVSKEEIHNMRTDVWFGMFFSNLVMFFIIAVCGATLFPNGVHHIATAKDAAEALRPIAGDLSYYLFTLGILGTGFLAIPVLAGSSAYALAEAFKKEEGLYQTFTHARFFYGVIIVSVILGYVINFSGISAMDALFYSAVLNGIVAPLMLFFIVRISSSREIMGEWANTTLQKYVGWVVFAIMLLVGLAAVVEIVR